jgi:SP family sugar:H+ symporter-like MFS transporter
MADHSQNIFTTLWKEKRIVSICFFVAISQFQYGFDSAAVSGFQGMPGFLAVFGYVDVSTPKYILPPSISKH